MYSASGLVKRELLSLPDPFGVVTVDGEQTSTTAIARKTLSPAWNENFDVWVFRCLQFNLCLIFMSSYSVKYEILRWSLSNFSTTGDSGDVIRVRTSILSYELPHLHLSSGFLGVYNISAADALDLALSQPGDLGSSRFPPKKTNSFSQKAPFPEILQCQATIFRLLANLYLAFLWNVNLSHPSELILNDP